MEYIARIKKAGGHWLVDFPDCPGCQTFGDTKEEAVAMAHEALEGWLETHLLHGDVPSRPTTRPGIAIAVRPRLTIAIQIRWLREDLGLTQGALAKRIGVSQQQIAKLENPDANPTIATLVDIASKMHASLIVTIALKPTRKKRARSTSAILVQDRTPVRASRQHPPVVATRSRTKSRGTTTKLAGATTA